ncbi:MFS transporter [Burkholderia cepacia]|uniref:Major facilitator transporter n=1 Tax=Burkholderia cepacia GG4 TaxID=1009846 RepID=A0A9W3PAV1_BURCE|nr:MFS transporter [Burkholderia cepacia]AFQ49890.1 major facilitator transporter [Burkholderia cepacia GG4]
MRLHSALFLLVGTLLTAGGYGATFLLSMRFGAIGGNDVDTGVALAGAMAGTSLGVSLVGWFSQHIGTTRMAALAALCVGAGVAGFAIIERVGLLDLLPGFLIGFGWGAFYVAAPMSLAERTNDADRGLWFFRFATFQMAGIGACPALAAFAIRSLHWSVGSVLYTVGGLCVIASLMLETFGRLSPRAPESPLRDRWLRNIGAIARTRALYPIVMIALGASVFSGLMTFQMSLVQGTHAHASTFFSLYAVTVVLTRWLLSRLVINVRSETATKALLVMMVLGIAAMFAVPYHASFQSAAAVLLGAGYGLVYPVIQAQAVNDSEATHRRSALTWFAASYFIGVFGFPSVGGWVMVHVGKNALLALIALCGLAALTLAILQDGRVSTRLR